MVAGSFIHRLDWATELRLGYLGGMFFEILGDIENIEVIATGSSSRVLPRLRKHYGQGRWRKMKGSGRIRFRDGTIVMAELHWYEAHGIGRREIKIKYIINT